MREKSALRLAWFGFASQRRGVEGRVTLDNEPISTNHIWFTVSLTGLGVFLPKTDKPTRGMKWHGTSWRLTENITPLWSGSGVGVIPRDHVFSLSNRICPHDPVHVVRFLFLPKWGVVVVVERKGGDKERERTARAYAREILSTPGAAVCLGYGWFFNFACRQAGRKLKKNSI